MPVYKFTPDLMSEEELREISVGREKILKRITDELGHAAKGKFRNHYLFIGPRGIGKTHFLLLLYYTIKEGKLNKNYIPVKFAEKEPSITNMYRFMIRILERLSQEGPDQSVNIQTVRKMGPREGLEYALETLNELRKRTGKQIILLLENLHRLFKALGRADKARLRSLLQEDDTFIVIGTAPIYLKEVSNAGDPMYLFFKQETLTGLSDEEAIGLLENLDRISGNKRINIERDSDRIKGLNRLTGGFPRLLIWLYEIFSTYRVVDVEKNIFQLLDDLSSYYDLRMEGIPPQQEVLVDALAQFDGPARPKELSELTGMSVRTVSSQLKRLSKSGYIKKVFPEKRKKAAIYEISDSLFRLWRDVREPLGREKVTLIIRFFKLWYGPEEMIEEFGRLEMKAYEAYESGSIEETRECLRYLCYIPEAAPGTEMIQLHGRLFQAYEETGMIDEAEKEAERLMSRGKLEGRKDKQLAAYIDHLKLNLKKGDTKKLEKFAAEFMKFDSEDTKLWLVKASLFDKLGMYDEALTSYEKLTEHSPTDPSVWLGAGNYSYKKGRFNKCLKQYEIALEQYKELREKEPDIIRHKQNFATTNNNLGLLLSNLGRRKEALDKYGKALEMREGLLKSDPKNVLYISYVAATSNNLGLLLSDLGRREEALEKYGKALEMYEKLLKNDPENIVYISYVAMTSNNLGTLLSDLGCQEEALEKYGKALEMREELLNRDPDNVIYRSYVAMTRNNLGALLRNLGHREEALDKFGKALEMYEKLLKSDPENVLYISYVAGTSNNLGNLLSDLGRREEALDKYNKALEMREELLKSDAANVVYISDVAMSNNNLGNLLIDLGRREEALEKCTKALEMRWELLSRDPENVVYISYVAGTSNNLGTLLSDLGRREEALEKYNKAIKMYEELLSRDPANVVYISHVAMTSNNLGTLLHDLERREEALEKNGKAIEMYEELLSRDPANVVYLSGVAATSNNLGALLRDMGHREEALEKYNKALEMYEELLKNDPENVLYRSDVAMTSNNLGTLLSDRNQEIEAAQHFDKAKLYASALPDKGVMLWISRSWLFMKTEKYDKAIADSEKALETANDLGWKAELFKAVSNLITIHLTLSKEFFIDKEMKKARIHFLEALKTSKRVETADMERDVVDYLKVIAPSGEHEFIGEILGEITEELGKEYDDLLKPYIKALEYARTGDPDVLLVLHQEQREVAREIAELMTGGEDGKGNI